ncbi:hypothetical protein [Nocardia cyriacigeorgica]|uniref:hypothetical protein n=1 Tax=Nocardia cyriacigeorgica TaxID=135487 RepID=UPI0018945255|nr:hypothetical protein [Nocardia cyriacigeorgica]MBF6093558.1 hypothetical protein [Nocardia cyriacigeorgica]
MSTVLEADAERAAADSLRQALRWDGWGTGLFGAALLAGAVALRDPLGLPTAWSIPFGVAMVGGGLALLLIAGYPIISARHAAVVVAVNGASAVAMTVLAFSGMIDLTAAGVVFLLVGAVIVAVFAVVEGRGLRRAGRYARTR